MRRKKAYVIEDRPEGRTLVVTGRWTVEAEAALQDPSVDGVWLNYARGFCEPDLSFIGRWPIRRLLVIDRGLTDLAPTGRLGETLEDLSIQAAPGTPIDLSTLPNLRSLAAAWDGMRASVADPDYLSELVIFDYDEVDLDPLAVQPSLQHVKLKVARHLSTFDGVEALPTLTSLRVAAARELHDIDALPTASATLRELDFESCLDLYDIDRVSTLVDLLYLGISDCGRLASLKPIRRLSRLGSLYAWGSTRIEDNDLSPLLGLSSLKEIRMRPRREYQPSLAEVKQRLGCA